MQKTTGGTRQTTATVAAGRYRERLSPSLWTIVAAAVVAPMAALVFVPLDTSVSLAVGVIVAVAVVWVLIAASPVVRVADGELHAGVAHIDAAWLGTPIVLTGDDAREGRGPGLDARAWHLIRGGLDGLVRVPLTDPDDPVTEWVISSRTPDRLAAAIEQARATRRTPGR